MGKDKKSLGYKSKTKPGMFIGTDGTRFVPVILGYLPQGELQILLMTQQGDRTVERVLNYYTTEYRDKVLEYFDKGFKTLDLREPEPEPEEDEGGLL